MSESSIYERLGVSQFNILGLTLSTPSLVCTASSVVKFIYKEVIHVFVLLTHVILSPRKRREQRPYLLVSFKSVTM